ncbi:MAG: UDP-N-acetylglucosamine 2-epimerase (non-hydrolyzing) [Rikenellaceae bacterium]|nr:UDP-N-acetylglucosamine 2-epimerase (non-hydrolyzing) [Rikenellaceae bacterium]
MKKIMLVFGTRPEAIKMAPLIIELQKHLSLFKTIITVTAQHREMLDQVLSLFKIVPDYDLNIMKQGQDLYDVTSNVLLGMRDVLKEAKPDIVLVHGDTSTSTAAALAAFYAQIPVGHIEAGLRTNNIYSPWPEEMNRRITGRLSTLHFAPTPLSKENLLRENTPEQNIFITGNTVIDALHLVIDQIKNKEGIEGDIHTILNNSGITSEEISSWKESERRMVLITGHRRENFGEGFINICNAIKVLSDMHPETDFLYPMHLNPNVRKAIREVFGENKRQHDNTIFVEPLEYLPFVYLMHLCTLVLTDSGGIQEEAPGLGKPVLVMRNTTERPEALSAGTVKLVGTNKDLIVEQVDQLLTDSEYYNKMSRANNPYGDGLACKRIIEQLAKL